MSSVRVRLPLPGPLVKRLRHRPFTAVTWVRFPYGSPNEKSRCLRIGIFCFMIRCGNRKAVKKTCRWHVFRPWEIPFVSERSQQGCEMKQSIRGTFCFHRGVIFLLLKGIEPSNARVRWTLAWRQLDGANTLIPRFPTGHQQNRVSLFFYVLCGNRKAVKKTCRWFCLGRGRFPLFQSAASKAVK